jgi:hypothetical protein
LAYLEWCFRIPRYFGDDREKVRVTRALDPL